MFRDLKEYQEIAKIYADKVSKPENLEERRGSSVEQLKKNRETVLPATPPQKGAGGGVGNPTNVRGSGAGTAKPIVRGAQGRTRRPQPEIKKFPSTAEIRAKNPNAVGGGNAGASTDAGLASTANMPKATPVSAEPKKKLSGKERAQAMAKARIKSGKTIQQVKDENKASMKARAKERVYSFRDSFGQWNPKGQRPELWNLYNGRVNQGEHIRVFPISNWTELDIWQYIHLEKIPIVPLYLAKPRPVVERDGVLILVDDERQPMNEGEESMMKTVRFRTLGCYPLTGAVESDADTLPDVIQEMLLTTTSEREGRVIDFDSSASMEKKKQEGYF